MNRRQLEKLGVPRPCMKTAITAVRSFAEAESRNRRAVKQHVRLVLAQPDAFVEHPQWGPLANDLIQHRDDVPGAAVAYRTWGEQGIDRASHKQMQQACGVPVALAGALMADAHVGYGLPIGGVLACDNAVIPYAVGVDIACRMKLSILDLPPASLNAGFNLYQEALQKGTRFGVGVEHQRPQSHAVMDQDWNISRITRERKDKAWRQLGTSGSGNHFVEFGILTFDHGEESLPIEPGEYVALLSHSGSRGVGAAVCATYSDIARSKLPSQYRDLARLAWLDLDTEAGQEYWAAMNLMGDYAAANHDVIHRLVCKHLGARVIAGVENHHNFAWREAHGGRDMIVHRKGATPAGPGVLGVIPGSMADPAFVVRGKGEPSSLNSASHGAGRRMSRKQAKSQYTWSAVRKQLADQGIRVISAGADEVPAVYKDICEVMRQQSDLVAVVARFDPKIVKMCDDGSRAED